MAKIERVGESITRAGKVLGKIAETGIAGSVTGELASIGVNVVSRREIFYADPQAFQFGFVGGLIGVIIATTIHTDRKIKELEKQIPQ